MGGDANQSPPFADVNLYLSDSALREAVARAGVDASAERLAAFGADWGSALAFEQGRLANDYPPVLRTHDPRGERLDIVEFHPAWHWLMGKSAATGLRGSTWEGGSHVARAARVFMAYQAEAGHMCPITMTHAAVAALRVEPRLAEAWTPKILDRSHDPAFRPWFEKSAVTIGMGMTERQGGTDVRANSSMATPRGDHYEITGEKWFMSAPMCDAFLVLAQAAGGLTCFLMPRFTPDGGVNAIHFRRLKPKLGNRSNASSEVQFNSAFAERVGAEGSGVRTIINMVQLTRVDCVIASAGLMRLGLAYAVHHARRRKVFGKRLIDHPAMRATLADLALDVEANTALAIRLARALDRSMSDPDEATYARMLTPAIKYFVCKSAPGFLYEAMECLGGNGYVEESPLARAYREAPVNAIWEGSGSVMALDVLRAAARAPLESARLIERISDEARAPADRINAGLASNEPEAAARATTEHLARLAALAALREGRQDLADAYVETRLMGLPRATYGACDLRKVEDTLLTRAFVD